MENTHIARLVEAARSAPSADNMQPWHLERDGDSLLIRYDTARVDGDTFPPDSPGSLLSIGALVENLVSLATAAGLEPELELAAAPGALPDAHYGRLRFRAPGNPIDAENTSHLWDRHTDRGPFAPTALPEGLVEEFSLVREGDARSWLSQSPERCRDVARLVERASRIRFCTREVHEWLGKSLRFDAAAVARADGLDVATLALPPGGKSFLRLIADWRRLRVLNRLGAYRLLAAIDAAPVRRGPCLLAIIADDTPRGCIDAGRLLERLWISLNAQGVAVHPYYVVADQVARLRSGGVPPEMNALARELAAETREVFGLQAEESLHMILRLGYSKKPANRSLRLPLATVYSEKR